MGGLVLNGATSGSTTIQATDAVTATITLPSTSGTVVVNNGAQTIEFADGSASAPSITNSGDTNTGIFFPAADTIAFTEGGTEAMRIDSSGNLGLGVTPSAWSEGKSIELRTVGNAIWSAGNADMRILSGAYYNSGYKYSTTGNLVSGYIQAAGTHSWYTAPSGTAGNAITLTTAMTLDASGNLLLGGTTVYNSASGRGNAIIEGSSTAIIQFGIGGTLGGYIYHDGTVMDIRNAKNGAVSFATNGSERMNIGAGGAVTIANTAAENTQIFTISKSGTPTIAAYLVSVGGWNGAASGVNMGRNSSTSRSISAGGSINANGADYAEYMTKAGDFTIAKGDVTGIDANGKLTNVFADAVSFVVKSTDPSYVGGDSWGNEETLGVTFPKQPVRAEDDTDETFADKEAQYVADKAIVDEALEAARQLVDRIAFAGQVPVNVLGATAGQYIIPVNDNGAIKGEAVTSPTFEQYQTAVGKVIAIEADGRARIIVKVA